MKYLPPAVLIALLVNSEAQLPTNYQLETDWLINNSAYKAKITPDKKNKNINCSNIIKGSQDIVSGRGGGRPDMAQGSGDAQNTNKFIQQVETLLKEI